MSASGTRISVYLKTYSKNLTIPGLGLGLYIVAGISSIGAMALFT